MQTGAKNMREDKTVIVGTVKEAAHAGYDQGFREGYQAACLVVEVLAEAERKGGGLYAAGGILKALKMSREKALEMMGASRFEVAPVPVHPAPATIH